MIFEEINIPTVISEVTSAFNRYQEALEKNDIAVLDELFWHDSRTVRFGINENLYGIEQIRQFRRVRLSNQSDRILYNTIINTFGYNYAVCCTEFTQRKIENTGRQQQTWVKMPFGWRIVAAQVSLIN
ncbi:oxalurate catabolism protein HpxZ [Candidatus Pantoea carbekii]|nr:oxalurate catabolism protein HpxZ [Candidatus Pantoea carbekii]AKC32255.1 hypothetical protein BMSBPS_0455 [Candidatus Pantoea carbekii]